MNGRILIVTMHNKYGERQVYIMPETFAVEVETNGTEIYVSFKRFVDDKEKIASMVVMTEDCDTDVLTQEALCKFQSKLVDEICQGICKHLLQREQDGPLFYNLEHYAMAWVEPTKSIYNSLVYDKSNLKQ